MSLLSIKSLSVSYGSNKVIDNLDLQVEPGEIVALFGPSGSGKSTVLKAVTGLLDGASGTIELNNTVLLSEQYKRPTEQRNIGLIFQDYALFPHLTVAQNICFGLFGEDDSTQQNIVTELLTLVKMTEYKDVYPHQLSGGQQQRVAIVRALATKPNLLLFDEAFSNLDPQFRFELIEEMRVILKQRGITGLFVTHNQDEAFAFCDRIAVLHKGLIAQIDSPENLFSYPSNKFVAEFLGQGVWLPAKVINEHTLSSEWGDLPYAGKVSIANRVGETVDVYLRPHQIGLREDDAGAFKVEHERFVGEFYQVELAWCDQILKIRTHHSFIKKQVTPRVKQPVLSVFASK